MTREEFIARWTARSNELERLGAMVNGARLCSDLLADFEAFVEHDANELVDLRTAASISGYSSDRLRKLATLGRLPAEKRGRRLYFRKCHLPKKAPSFDDRRPRGYDPVADARRVATQP